MNVKEAKKFAEKWKERGDEKQDTQTFWIELLHKVVGDEDYADHIQFEVVADKLEGGKNFKDAILYRHTDHAVLIEQKGMKWSLDKREPRFGTLVTPFEQAKHYDDLSAVNDKARWIVTCNFQEFWIYDMTKTGKDLIEPVAKLPLKDLSKHLDWLNMLAGIQDTHDFTKEVDVSVKAGDLVGILYNDLHKNYINPDDPEILKQLNILCVRIVFCLYAEDAGLFDKNNRKIFHDYLAQYDARGMRKALVRLFEVLDQKEEERDPYLADDDPLLAEFPYVNGGLFKGKVTIPPFTDETVDILLNKESLGFDWSKISPTIFGAVFESTLNPEKRREGGMHYTSIENIHKVIDPLFLDDLTNELDNILTLKKTNVRNKRLMEFQIKLSNIKGFDPACGSGNFLTESYLSLRRLENKALKTLVGKNIAFGFLEENVNLIKVSIQQFYGIEINDFAVSVARTALWIAEAQMFEETQSIFNGDKDFLPLQTFTNIHEGNALRMDWDNVIDRRTECLYIYGNPPFLGYSLQSKNQKKELLSIYCDDNGKPYQNSGKNDYVSGWFFKAAQFIYKTSIKVGFVATNSITQGEQVTTVWKPLYERFGIQIDFAYKTFQWDSEANLKAHVHCVIIGFSANPNKKKKKIYSGELVQIVDNISPYLRNEANVFITSRNKPLCEVPEMTTGNRPADGGNLIIESDEYSDFIKKEPNALKYIRKLTGAAEFINNKPRYCLWLVGVLPSELKGMPEVLKRVEACRNDRLKGAPDRQKLADTPTLFRETKNPHSYIIVPATSSEARRYVPMGFLGEDTIPTNSAVIIPDAQLYHFGVLESSVHMAWMRVVAGRLKSDYRYSKDIVYNNFPWPTPTEAQEAKIAETAQAILDARSKYPEASLADMYDPDYSWMYPELLKAHEENDKAVMDAYEFKHDMSESDIVTELMKMYQEKISNLE